MAAYNFQQIYVGLIESGRKCSTIRKRRKNGYLPRPGEVVRLYNGMRTRACKLIREVTVTEVLPIVINADHGRAEVVLNARLLTGSEVERLAAADGFPSVRDFSEFFHEKYGPSVNGYLIRWAAD